jgi:Holliday junction resolvase RusA-like endonuclease
MKIIIKGIPMAKQSARFAKRGKFMAKYQPAALIHWIEDAKAQIREQLPENWIPIQSPVKIIWISFIYPPLKTWTQKKKRELEAGLVYKETRPDIDNLLKNLWDACNGLVWIDDGQIVELNKVNKLFGEIPMTIMEIDESWMMVQNDGRRKK